MVFIFRFQLLLISMTEHDCTRLCQSPTDPMCIVDHLVLQAYHPISTSTSIFQTASVLLFLLRTQKNKKEKKKKNTQYMSA